MESGEGGGALLLPLLEKKNSNGNSNNGGSSWSQTLVNIVVSIVGSGVLGLPYAFRVAGWLAGSLGVAAAGIATYYCMTLLVECRERLAEGGSEESSHIHSYGDLGAKAFGKTGRFLTELLVLISQAGGAIAYLVFIGHNLSSVFSSIGTPPQQTISPPVFIFLVLLPLEIVLSFIRSLSSLAPFSAFADACNVLAMAIVIKEDFQLVNSFNTRKAFNGSLGLPFAAGVAVFCFEGFSLTLPLEASMSDRRKFRRVLSLAFLMITVAYICFGIFGYLAYGDETKDIITLNLPNTWTTAAVKIGLCIGLAFTFPIMMHPIYDIMEAKLKLSGWFQKICYNIQGAEVSGLFGIRMLMVALMATLASYIPGFGAFVSLVGSTLCALLSFVLPASFHLALVGPHLKSWQRMLDYAILLLGVAFAGYGTYEALFGDSTRV